MSGMQMEVGQFYVETTSNVGHSPEFYADRICDRLLRISETAPPELREQAFAYRESMRQIILGGIRRANLSDRTTVIGELRKAGMDAAAHLVWKMGT